MSENESEEPKKTQSVDDGSSLPRSDDGAVQQSQSPSTPQGEAMMAMALGFLFWALLIGGGLYYFLHEKNADILLDIDERASVVKGRVVYEGIAVDGVLQMRASSARTKQLLYSTTIDVKNGVIPATIITTGEKQLAEGQVLRIDTEFRGTFKEQGAKETKAVRGDTTVFLHGAPPLSPETVYWSGGTLLLFFVIFTSLITGSMGSAKAHLLFAFMYLSTFLALAVPIALSAWVAQNPYLRERMEQSPIGIVLAQSEGARHSQWLINIGGRVVAGGGTATPESPKAPSTPPPQSAKVQTPTAPVADPVGTKGESSPPAPQNPGDTSTSETPPVESNQDSRSVEGGLTVPFFVVMLAMFGAGVNLTRKVPAIQKEYYGYLRCGRRGFAAATASFIASLFSRQSALEEQDAAKVRQALVQNIMYFAAAPFLGIAVYYLLRVVATDVTQPALVIASFATGLVSDRIVEKVIEVAQDVLKLKSENGGAAGKEKERQGAAEQETTTDKPAKTTARPTDQNASGVTVGSQPQA